MEAINSGTIALYLVPHWAKRLLLEHVCSAFLQHPTLQFAAYPSGTTPR